MPTFGIFDADLAGLEMCDLIRIGRSTRNSSLNRACCVSRLVRIGINPFVLAMPSPIPMIRMNAQVEGDFADKLAKFESDRERSERGEINFEYHRTFYESVALHLIIGFTASANDTPVHIAIQLIDSLSARFVKRLCLKMSDGLDYFKCADELAFFWIDQYEWERVDFIRVDAVIKHEIVPPILIERFISILNAMPSARSKKIDMHSMAFNSGLNSYHVFSGELDTQIMQVDISNYICVYADEETVDVCGFCSTDYYAKAGIVEVLKKRYDGKTVSEYQQIPVSNCPAYLSGVYFCHFATCIVLDCSPALNQSINTIDLITWFKKILIKKSPLGPYVQNTQIKQT